MGKGTERNQLCWCGSGKKFKQCHINRNKQEKIQPYELDTHIKKIKNGKKCFAPKEWQKHCDKKIIRAHTISKSVNLKRIADTNNQFYSFSRSAKIHGPQLKKIGINQASTYNIFCSKHDAQLFSLIENRKFALENDQIFLIAYRNICYELYLKERIYQTRLERMQFDRGAQPIRANQFSKPHSTRQPRHLLCYKRTFYTQGAI